MQIANLDHLPSLRVLMLGKNQIEKIGGLNMLATPAPSMDAHAHIHAHTSTHARTLQRTTTHTRMRACIHRYRIYACKHTHTHMHTLTHMQTPAHTHTLTGKHPRTHRSHTHCPRQQGTCTALHCAHALQPTAIRVRLVPRRVSISLVGWPIELRSC